MDRKKQIAALTDDEGERLLLAQACERLTRAEQRGIPAATVFLTPREQALLRQLDLPEHLTANGMLEALNLLVSREELESLLKDQ
mgnify:CR=1 FL=1